MIRRAWAEAMPLHPPIHGPRTALLASVSSGIRAPDWSFGGPSGVGKSSVAKALVRLMPETLLIDKDHTAGGFVLQAT